MEWWHALFSRTPELKVLALESEHNITAALQALQNSVLITNRESQSEAYEASTTLTSSRFPCALLLPHLKELFLSNMDFGISLKSADDWDLWQRHIRNPSSDNAVSHLMKYLELYQDHGQRLEKLTFRRKLENWYIFKLSHSNEEAARSETSTITRVETKYFEGLVQEAVFDFSRSYAELTSFGLYPRIV
jgi:hypothetical protein